MGILIFQDLAVIPILLLMAFLSNDTLSIGEVLIQTVISAIFGVCFLYCSGSFSAFSPNGIYLLFGSLYSGDDYRRHKIQCQSEIRYCKLQRFVTWCLFLWYWHKNRCDLFRAKSPYYCWYFCVGRCQFRDINPFLSLYSIVKVIL